MRATIVCVGLLLVGRRVIGIVALFTIIVIIIVIVTASRFEIF